jgi:outer membrane protein
MIHGYRVWLLTIAMTLPLCALAEEQVPVTAPVPVPTIGVVDVDEVLQQASVAKMVRAQAEKYRQDYQQQSVTEENNLRTVQQSIEQERKNLSSLELADKTRSQALAERVHSFEASVADYRRKELAWRQALEKSFNQAMVKVQQAMNQAMVKTAEAHHLNLVLPRGQVMLFDPKMNITKEVIALMDKALPSTDFLPPEIATEAPPAAPAQSVVKKKN